jgi:glycine dehydrogenase
MLRYLRARERKDLVAHRTSMIPLGSCTMKLNATTEMIPVTWPEFGALHPFAPADQAQGYRELFERPRGWLCEITGFAPVSLQPNAGSAGRVRRPAGDPRLPPLARRHHRDVCLIPSSAHGTNPASAVMAGMKVVVVACDDDGNVDVADLKAKAEQHATELAALMVTYPSTHGVFEEGDPRDLRDRPRARRPGLHGRRQHERAGRPDRPGDIGADVCHLNLHKTFCIPHGGGGPGMGPIGVARTSRPSCPAIRWWRLRRRGRRSARCRRRPGAARDPADLVAYIAMMGGEGLRARREVAILNANYIAKRARPRTTRCSTRAKRPVAHECILDMRRFKARRGVEVEDIAKRLMDYGFHAPTMSFPVPGTLMIEPTESESKAELDRFCDAMIAIRAEIARDRGPHGQGRQPAQERAAHRRRRSPPTEWKHGTRASRRRSRRRGLREHKFWPPIGAHRQRARRPQPDHPVPARSSGGEEGLVAVGDPDPRPR